MERINLCSKIEEWDIGKEFNKIRILGTGGYGTVCQAIYEPTKTVVAIKKISKLFDCKLDCKRILREICLLHKLHHPNVVKLYDILDVKDSENFNCLYLIMECLQSDLNKLIKSGVELEIEKIQKLIYNVLVGLKYTHSAGVLHLYIKPSNILIISDCSVCICDL